MFLGGRFVAEWHPEVIAIVAVFHAIVEQYSLYKDFKNTFPMAHYLHNIPLCNLQNTGAQREIVYQDLVLIFLANNFVAYLHDDHFDGDSEEFRQK